MNVRFRPSIVTKSGRRESWIKHVTSIDNSQSGGYCYVGDFLHGGRETELPVGSVLLRVDPEGSVKNNWQSGHILRLEADGSTVELTESTLDWRDDALSIRDAAISALRAGDDCAASVHPVTAAALAFAEYVTDHQVNLGSSLGVEGLVLYEVLVTTAERERGTQ